MSVFNACGMRGMTWMCMTPGLAREAAKHLRIDLLDLRSMVLSGI